MCQGKGNPTVLCALLYQGSVIKSTLYQTNFLRLECFGDIFKTDVEVFAQ